MRIPLLVLNFNGRRLLADCLPSLVQAAASSRHDCRVVVVDNASTDDSLTFLAAEYPQLEVIRQPNLGLCSYNRVLADLDDPVAVLLNNDVKLEEACVDRLVAPLMENAECGMRNAAWKESSSDQGDAACFMTAPLCWRFDRVTYEGQKTAVRWRWGVVQGTSFFPGHELGINAPGPTATAGAVIAVDRRKFLEIGGFDPLYLPGRIEDLDFAYRGFLAGYHALHVPAAVAYHLGQASFGEAFGRAGCDVLALRNILLFQWKHLRHPGHLLRQMCGYPARLALDFLRAGFVSRDRRWAFARALRGAWGRRGFLRDRAYRAVRSTARERQFFRLYHPARINSTLAVSRPGPNQSKVPRYNAADRPGPGPVDRAPREEATWR